MVATNDELIVSYNDPVIDDADEVFRKALNLRGLELFNPLV